MKVPKIKLQQLKPKRYKYARSTNLTCPYCLSQLIAKRSAFICTETNLKIWVKDFELYKTYTEEQKIEYMKTISNKDKFLQLYDLWLNSELICVYNIYYNKE